MAKRSPIFRNSDVAERVAPTSAARRIALDLQEVIHQLDVSLLRVRERGPRQVVICIKFDDFASIFYRVGDVSVTAKKRAWERWKKDVRQYVPDIEIHGATLDKADFCIDVARARSWSSGVMNSAGVTEPDEVVVVRSCRASPSHEESEHEPLSVPEDPTSEEIDQRASDCLSRCRASAARALRLEAERAAQRAADHAEMRAHPDLAQHRFRSSRASRGGGRPSKDEPCAVCSRPWRVHPITLAIPGARRDF